MKKAWTQNLLKSPFYREMMEDNCDFPLMNKKKFMAHFDDINTVGIKKEEAFRLAIESEKSRDFSPTIGDISIGLSSGTSGNRGIFLTSPKEKAIWVGAVLDRVIGFSFKKRKIAFFLRANNNLYEAVNSKLLSFDFFDLKIPLQKQFDHLINLSADILVAQPSVLMAIAKEYCDRNLTPTFSTVISVAEVLEDDYKKVLGSIFNCPIAQVYQCTEGFLAYTCKKGKLHLNEDWLEVEKKFLDDGQRRFHPIITDYLRTSQPVVRYELNDILHEDKSGCTCGSKATVIHRIEGRSDDVFSFQNGDIVIYPDFIRRAVLRASEDVVDYTVTLKDKKTIGVSLIVEDNVRVENVFQEVKSELIQLLNEYDIQGIQIVLVEHNHDQTSKFRRIKNEYTTRI